MKPAAAILIAVLFFTLPTTAQTVVRGEVKDNVTAQPIPFASIFFKNGGGVTADSIGRFQISSDRTYSFIVVSSNGYESLEFPIKGGRDQFVTVVLRTSANTSLNTVVVKSKSKVKYTNKNNPAVELIRNVIQNRDKNRPEQYDYIQYDQYEKTVLSLSRLPEKVKSSKLLQTFRFLLDNTDTMTVPGKALTPVYLEEKLSKLYYQKNPQDKKVFIEADRRANFGEFIDSGGVSAYLRRIYSDIDIYSNSISVFTNNFLSPIADIAPSFYMYYIRDTLYDKEGRKLVRMYFTPRNTNDFLFRGTMLVTLDSAYAVRQVNMTVSPNINMNWVRELYINQEFEKNSIDDRYHLIRSETITEAALTKGKTGGMYGKKTITYSNYRINDSILPMVFEKPAPEVLHDSTLTDAYWAPRRTDQLTSSESLIYRNVDSLRQMKSYKRFMDIATLLFAGYKSFDKVEIGPASTFYSFNPVEGFRLRFGGRTTPNLSKRVFFEAYAAYGFKDERWKGFLSATYSLNNKSIYTFPLHYLRFSTQRETKIPGQELQFIQEDNFLLSFKRGVNDKWLYNTIHRMDYMREFRNRLSIGAGFKSWAQSPAGGIQYIQRKESTLVAVPELKTSELSFQVRWAPNEQFYQGKIFRIPIINRYPILTIKYTRGVKGLFGGTYNYDQFNLMAEKRFYITQFGYADVFVDAGYNNGTIPFPLLSIHRANQTYAYQLNAYNLMNFLEFVSDRYVGVNVDYHLNGFLFNRVPLLQKLNLREIFSAKVLWGSLRPENDPLLNDSTYKFPVTSDGATSTFSLNNGPYIEGSIGVGNIFKLLRLDVVKRFTYLDNPNVSEYGIRARMRFDF